MDPHIAGNAAAVETAHHAAGLTVFFDNGDMKTEYGQDDTG